MTERLEYFGTPCELSEPAIVGDCEACGGETYDYEQITCPHCDRSIHSGCVAVCGSCGHIGCKVCMKFNIATDEHFCGDDCEREFLEKDNGAH